MGGLGYAGFGGAAGPDMGGAGFNGGADMGGQSYQDDVVDGDYRNKRPAHPYDLFCQGASQQLANVIDNYPMVEGIKTYFIIFFFETKYFC